jgi:RNA polymerase sigma-70 factor (sigma-E family)
MRPTATDTDTDPARPSAQAPPDPADEHGYAALFHAHFAGLTRLSALLGADDPEDVAQEAFVRLYRRRGRLRDPNAALGYLRATVCNLTRSRLRHLGVARRQPAERVRDVDSAEHDVIVAESRQEVLRALRLLPPRQREALVLRYWLGMSEADMAEIMQVSRGTVKAHVSRGIDALGQRMEERP